jgi:hypothetical protein
MELKLCSGLMTTIIVVMLNTSVFIVSYLLHNYSRWYEPQFVEKSYVSVIQLK